MAAKETMPGTRAIAQRITNAEERFIEYAMATALMTRVEAIHVLNVYRRLKAIKIDAVGGQFTFTHGAFAEAAALRRAMEVSR